MKCPYCNKEDTKVINKRETSNLEVTRRRRECLNCSKRFTTYERIETDLTVVKKDGRREQFNREKLKKSILRSCEKRPVDTNKIDFLINKIEAVLRDKNTSEIPSKLIGELVMKGLKELDKVAYIRFASVYRSFEDVADFKKEIKQLV